MFVSKISKNIFIVGLLFSSFVLCSCRKGEFSFSPPPAPKDPSSENAGPEGADDAFNDPHAGENDVPEARAAASAVWTGATGVARTANRVIVWGGYNFDQATNFLTSGGVYNPQTNAWYEIPKKGAPTGRYNHSAVWTGDKMIIWGGNIGAVRVNTGGIYDMVEETWVVVPKLDAPSPRAGHKAIWTGDKMIVWGGCEAPCALAGAFELKSNSWSFVSEQSAPRGSLGMAAVWTGEKLIIWGGKTSRNGPELATGGIYDPQTNLWESLSTLDAPSPRSDAIAVWTGEKLIIWGGKAGGKNLVDGGIYDLATKRWTLLAESSFNFTDPAKTPSGQGVWSDGELFTWAENTEISFGYRFNPNSLTWNEISLTNAPTPRRYAVVVAMGKQVLVWGGEGADAEMRYLDTGATYTPATGGWVTYLPDSPAEMPLY